MSLNFAEFQQIAPFIIGPRIDKSTDAPAGFPVLLKSHTGKGKSEFVYRLSRGFGLDVIERRTSQMTEGDLVGLPKLNENTTSWHPPEFFYEACIRPVILFFDEYDRGPLEVRQGIFEIADSRKLNGHHLHPGTKVIAAINGGLTTGGGSSKYQVGALDPAEMNRWWVVELEPTVDDWLKWATEKPDCKPEIITRLVEQIEKSYKKNRTTKTNICDMVYDFINQNRDQLDTHGNFDPNEAFPTRRSWKRFSDTIVQGGLFDKKLYPTFPIALATDIAAGFVGKAAALTFQKFHVDYDYLLDPADVLTGKGKEKYAKFDINDHQAFLRKLRDGDYLETELDGPSMMFLVDYWCALPKELLLMMFAIFGQSKIDRNNVIHFFTRWMPESSGYGHFSTGEYLADCVEKSEIDVEAFNAKLQEELKEQQQEDEA